MNRARSWTLLFVATALLSSACSDFEIKNKLPIAVATAVVGGMPVMPGKAIPYNGSPVAVTLSSAGSKDPDGSISRLLWMRTDVTPSQRYGIGDAGVAAAGDPPAGNNPMVMLDLGKHRFSLWVFDNDGRTSAPATLNLEVKVASNYMPDAACMTKYPNMNKECAMCVCSPMANKGCLELYKTCYENTDAMFSTLCDGITKCAIAGKCVGSACYAPAPLCQTQIMDAAVYMGAMFPASCSGEGATNPCAAASKLGACTNYDAMMVDGNCRSVCKF
jgi:hypothetical protein